MILREFEISLGSGVLPKVERKKVSWQKMCEAFTKHKKLAVREQGKHFAGGVFKNDYRKEENLEFRSILTLDIDDYEDGSYNDFLFDFSLSAPCAFILYSTYSSTPESPRLRALIPLSRNVTGDEYRVLSKAFSDTLTFKIDPASCTPAQMMWRPSSPDGTGWSFVNPGDCLNVEEYLQGYSAPEKQEDKKDDEDDGFETALTNLPLNLTEGEIDTYLEAFEAEGLPYEDWVMVGTALAHQYQQSEEGYLKWFNWSSLSSKHDGRQMSMKWKSFKGSRNPITFASVIHRAKSVVVNSHSEDEDGVSNEKRQSFFEKVCLRASQIKSVEDWDKFKKKIGSTSATLLPADLRKLVGKEVYEAWGSKAGLTRTDINTALKKNNKVETEAKGELVSYDEDLPLMKDGVVLKHIDNLKEILKRLGVIVRYNTITKKEEIIIPEKGFTDDNRDNATLAWIISECSLFGFPIDRVPEFISYIAEENQFSPVVEWVNSKPWDGVSRLEALYATVSCPTEEQDILKRVLMKRWLVSAIVGAYNPNGVSAGGVLVFQGEQALGKTMWFKNLVPSHLNLTKDGLMLRPDNKDSILQACSFWLAELGELDSTFRKSDISALKAFISSNKDVVRRPYARKDSHYNRRTVFFGSVNPKGFLYDETGNRRYWVVECKTINYNHGIDMQQLWAEVKVLWEAGEDHHLSPRELLMLNFENEAFMHSDPIEERLLSGLAWNAPEDRWRWAQSTDILVELGIREPSISQCVKCGISIKKIGATNPLVKFKRVQGKNLNFVPPCGTDDFNEFDD